MESHRIKRYASICKMVVPFVLDFAEKTNFRDPPPRLSRVHHEVADEGPRHFMLNFRSFWPENRTNPTLATRS